MILKRRSKQTITPFGLNHNDTIEFTCRNGNVWVMTLHTTRAEVLERKHMERRGYRDKKHEHGDISVYGFACDVSINGKAYTITREVGTQNSFYEPLCVDGVNIWFDACTCAFRAANGFMEEKDIRWGTICKPDHHARFLIHESDLPLCPETLYPWYPNDEKKIAIENCYAGEDCWMGPYNGATAHCGLDINMPKGTILSAPISFDYHYLARSVGQGFHNNWWVGIRRFTDGTIWKLSVLHIIDMLVPLNQPLARSTPYATTAGTAIGRYEHTHFLFEIIEQGGSYMVDPWILFWELFK